MLRLADLHESNHQLESRVREIRLPGSEGGALVTNVPTPIQIPSHAMHDEIRTYAELQRQIHYALREQHPEWVEPDGDSPTCNFYERRFAELLALFAKSGTRSAQTLNG